MPSRHPLRIALADGARLTVAWDDGHETVIPVDMLRAFCPCATCRKTRTERAGESGAPKRRALTVLGSAARFDIESMEHVGRYALGVNWKDSHRSILTWEYLADICPCDDCRIVRGGPPQPFDPLLAV